jgi:hypothetical protein
MKKYGIAEVSWNEYNSSPQKQQKRKLDFLTQGRLELPTFSVINRTSAMLD